MNFDVRFCNSCSSKMIKVAFLNFLVSQGSVATQWWEHNKGFIANMLMSPEMKKLKIGQQIRKLLTNNIVGLFYDSQCISTHAAISHVNVVQPVLSNSAATSAWSTMLGLTFNHRVTPGVKHILYRSPTSVHAAVMLTIVSIISDVTYPQSSCRIIIKLISRCSWACNEHLCVTLVQKNCILVNDASVNAIAIDTDN